MKNRWFSSRRKQLNTTKTVFLLAVLVVLFALAPRAIAGAPDWLRAVSNSPLPAYPPDTEAVLLLDEQVVTIRDDGEMKILHRRAYKILRPEGRHHGLVVVFFDNETRLSSLKAWCIPAQGKEYEVKEKDAIESNAFSEALYQDTRTKILQIPAAEPGNVVGYEYEQKERPYILQSTWWFQDVQPVRQARYVLQLPSGWEFKATWLNHPGREPQAMRENQWLWELADIPAVEREPAMPPAQAVEGRLILIYYPRDPALRQKSYDSWRAVGNLYGGLAAGRRAATPEIGQKVAELTSAAPTTLDKIRALAGFAQRDIRYVAIEIGIGSLQPHLAHEVFANRYGDCKDKATLLSTMLKEIGVESYYVLIHTRRGVVAPSYPPSLTFNHAILAIRLPEDVPNTGLFAVKSHERLGRLLFFDPTNRLVPLGYLPSSLQANFGLLVTEEGGELVELPLLPPSTSRLLRSAKLILSPLGTLSGEVHEIRWGKPAVDRRAQLLEAQGAERSKVLESFLAGFLGNFILTGAEVENLEKIDASLVLRYRFLAENYAKKTGNLLLLRPRVLGEKGDDLLERKERKYPVEFADATLQSDVFEIALPPGYEVDELPPPVELDAGFASYRSKVDVSGNVLRYQRTYEIKEVIVPTKRLEELKSFYRKVAADERSSAVLRRVSQ